MIKHSGKFIKRPKPHYTQLINVWADDKQRIDNIKILMIESKDFKLEKLKYNPVYKDIHEVIVKETNTELEKLDRSLIWSRYYRKEDFINFSVPFAIYSLILIPYIVFKVLHKRILERHVKHGYNAENLQGYNYWNLDFNNKNIYPESVIQLYFDMKAIKAQKEEEKEKQEAYNSQFIENIAHRYVNDMIQRRAALGFEDDED